MQKLNHNTTLIKEQELNCLIENIVRKGLSRKQLVTEGKKIENLLKGVAAGTISVAAALAFLYGPTDEEMRDANPNNAEMNRNVGDFSQPNDSTHQGVPVNKITPLKNESLHLTPSQFKQVIRESVCRILQEQGYNIGNYSMLTEAELDEASPWQKMKAFGKALGNMRNGGFKANYQNEKGNYDMRNAEDAIMKGNNQYGKAYADFQKKYANAKDDDKRAKLKQQWDNKYGSIKANTDAQYNKYMQNVDRSRRLANRANPNANLTQNQLGDGVGFYRQQGLGYNNPQAQPTNAGNTGNGQEGGWKPADYDPRTEQRYEEGYKKGYEEGLNAGKQQTAKGGTSTKVYTNPELKQKGMSDEQIASFCGLTATGQAFKDGRKVYQDKNGKKYYYYNGNMQPVNQETGRFEKRTMNGYVGENPYYRQQ